MKICEEYSHLKAQEIIDGKGSVLTEIRTFLNDKTIILAKNETIPIKKIIASKFNNAGWSDKVKVGTTNLTISFLKDEIGVCFQLGNVARTYADVLKLCLLGEKNKIKAGIIIVPDKLESKILGANYADYQRLANEIKLFKDILRTPILIIGLSN